ncbi:hypothetical protein CEE37_01220 [candidate division LCP-89 bacterium B3_LCP]|uniref:PorV/PorQ family protein n=1 Tax=candidate division LCP-89 bacterium B3_LCP TaxID=2012998 RepID=A0A532V565_UNCL8|nr:MAG: hypothetical protein CEE37_01220 [candidate division LCP-89 bacterium B3_LCP]
MRKLSTIALLTLLLFPGLCWGQAKVGTAGVNFLKVGVSARAMGMAEAFIGVADDASALYYNPGGLMQLDEADHILTHISYPAGIQFEYLGTAWPIPRLNAVVGAHITFLHTDKMNETTPEQPYGTGRQFTASDLAMGVTYAQKLTDKFSVGGNVKIIEERLADQKATGVAFDVGTFYETGWKSVVIAMAITNFGPDMNFVDSPFPMPINFKFGGSMRAVQTEHHSVILALEGSHPNDNLEQFNIGVEYSFMDLAFLRAGKKINGWKRYTWDEFQTDNEKDPYIEYPVVNEDGSVSLDGLCLGAGIRLRLPTLDIRIDYAYTNVEKLGSMSFFTLGINMPSPTVGF